MILDNPTDTLVQFVAAIKPRVDFLARLPEVGLAVERKLQTPNWAFFNNNNAIVFRNLDQRHIRIVSFNSLSFQTLGLAGWTEVLQEHIDVASISLERLNVDNVARLSLKCSVFLDMKMTHPEMFDAMFGSYLMPHRDLKGIGTELNDVLLSLFGKEGDDNFQLSIAPQTPEQSASSFNSWPNIDSFNDVRQQKVNTPEIVSRITRPNLMVELDLYRTEQAVSHTPAFMRDSLVRADKLVRRVVNRFLSMPL
jgi:hypothetical protein